MGSDLVYSGTASAPSAGGAVVQSAALGQGTYQVTVTAYLEGTGTPAVGTDDNNMALYSDSTEIGPIACPAAKNVPATTTATFFVAAGKKITVEAVANATASVVYAASMVITQTEAG